jgi:hypothetical protein
MTFLCRTLALRFLIFDFRFRSLAKEFNRTTPGARSERDRMLNVERPHIVRLFLLTVRSDPYRNTTDLGINTPHRRLVFASNRVYDIYFAPNHPGRPFQAADATLLTSTPPHVLTTASPPRLLLPRPPPYFGRSSHLLLVSTDISFESIQESLLSAPFEVSIAETYKQPVSQEGVRNILT